MDNISPRLHSDTAAGGELELEVPMMGRGSLAFWCFRRVHQSDTMVIDADQSKIEVQRYTNRKTLSKIESARRIHTLILERCHGDIEKFELVCMAAEIDRERPEDGISLKQIVNLQSVFNKVFHAPLLR